MANRSVNFTFSPGTPVGNQTNTELFILTVKDSGGNVVYGPSGLNNMTRSTSIQLPIGTGYTATLAARDSGGVTDASPPSVTFDVPPPPPPPAPPDPTLNPPTIS